MNLIKKAGLVTILFSLSLVADVNVNDFLGEYELVDDISNNCDKFGYEKIGVYNTEENGVIQRNSLGVKRLGESSTLAFSIFFRNINGESVKIVPNWGECKFYKAKLRRNRLETSSKPCLEFFWQKDYEMTLDGDSLQLTRFFPTPEYFMSCKYKKIN